MNATTTTIGNQIDASLRASAQTCNIAQERPQLISDVLAALSLTALSDADKQQLAMLRTTAGHISECLDIPLDQLTINALVPLAPQFTTYLQGRRHRPNAIRAYRNYLNVLLRKAKALGWTPAHPEVPKAWEPIIAALAKVTKARGIVRYAIAMGKTPSTLTDRDLSDWAQMMLTQKRSYNYVIHLQGEFRRELAKAGLAGTLPGIFREWKSQTSYCVPLESEKFPPALRQEVKTVLKWKQAPYAKGRRAKSQIRPISAKKVESAITQMYGFLVNVMPHLPESVSKVDPTSIRTLPDLVTPESVSAYIDWRINVRLSKGQSVASRLTGLCGALNEHPFYKDTDFKWLNALIDEIPLEPESQRRERKVRKYLPYDTVADVPNRIHGLRVEAERCGVKDLAWIVHDELLMNWLVQEP